MLPSSDALRAQLEEQLGEAIADDKARGSLLLARLDKHLPHLVDLYNQIYGHRADYAHHIEDLVARIGRAWLDRLQDLKSLDSKRESDPLWFQSNRMIGGVCYVDRFAGNLKGVRDKISYFKELGLTYLHLMPPYRVPAAADDGGYAVSSYRQIDPRLGSWKEMRILAAELRTAGISLALDFVANHTADDSEWAQQAAQGDPVYSGFYHLYPDRTMPDRWESTLREIFPNEHSGAFTRRADLDKWVWTTFHEYQWDLNYSNPAVFNHMIEELLFLANQGAEILRLDAVAFLWKEIGTSCENLPGAHKLVQAFNAVTRIACPAVLLKSEAIVHPDEVIKYISSYECELSYNPTLMAALWDAVATRNVGLLSRTLLARHHLPPDTAWINYVRGHDDIGWGFSDEDALLAGIDPAEHRRHLTNFYTGRIQDSFARGLPFQDDPKTGDCRVSGTTASLAGLEESLDAQDRAGLELAIHRILLLHGIIITAGGIPLLFLGDEIGTLNDYSFRNSPSHAQDSRWVHRPRANWDSYSQRSNPRTVEGRIFLGLQALLRARRQYPFLAGGELEVILTGNDHVLGYLRRHGSSQGIIFANFSEARQVIRREVIARHVGTRERPAYGRSTYSRNEDLSMEPLDLLVIA